SWRCPAPITSTATTRRSRLLCVYGSDEKADSACPPLAGRNAQVEILALPGAHHFDGDYTALAKRLLDAAQAPAASNGK
ncbi:MAG TPA: AcvB/VirJ family lysyl-phosphatidylglycerol hydrolase, partial [Plasticicumulans sp.]|nr:AcvB/VirJ family lysyl-phosphatidylglycerol hydrolase [Plasticicumulans sp.]